MIKHRIWLPLIASVTFTVTGCELSEPLTGRPCADDRDCQGGDRVHHCATDVPAAMPQVCVPGERALPPRQNRPPIVGTNVTVVRAGESVTATLSITDPDDDALTVTLDSPATGLAGLLVFDGKDFTYTADEGISGMVNDRFRLIVHDGTHDLEFNLLVVVVGQTDAESFSTWTGQHSADPAVPGNWDPTDHIPDAAIDILVPAADNPIMGSAPLFVSRALTTAGASLSAPQVSIHGDAAFATGRINADVVLPEDGPLVSLAGEMRELEVMRDAKVISPVHLSVGGRHTGGALGIVQGTTFEVDGNFAQGPGAGNIEFWPDESERLFAPPTMIVTGHMTLTTSIQGVAGRVMVGQGLNAPALQPSSDIEFCFLPHDDETELFVPRETGAFLRHTIVEEGTRLRALSNTEILGDVELHGELLVVPGSEVRVRGTVFVYRGAEAAVPTGPVIADFCVAAPQTVLPAHLECVGQSGGGAPDAGIPDDQPDASAAVADGGGDVADAAVDDAADAGVDGVDAAVDVADASVDVPDASVDVPDAAADVPDAAVEVVDAGADAGGDDPDAGPDAPDASVVIGPVIGPDDGPSKPDAGPVIIIGDPAGGTGPVAAAMCVGTAPSPFVQSVVATGWGTEEVSGQLELDPGHDTVTGTYPVEGPGGGEIDVDSDGVYTTHRVQASGLAYALVDVSDPDGVVQSHCVSILRALEQTYTTSGNSGDWNSASAWNELGSPDVGDDAVVSDAMTLGFIPSVNRVWVEPSGSIDASWGSKLFVGGAMYTARPIDAPVEAVLGGISLAGTFRRVKVKSAAGFLGNTHITESLSFDPDLNGNAGLKLGPNRLTLDGDVDWTGQVPGTLEMSILGPSGSIQVAGDFRVGTVLGELEGAVMKVGGDVTADFAGEAPTIVLTGSGPNNPGDVPTHVMTTPTLATLRVKGGSVRFDAPALGKELVLADRILPGQPATFDTIYLRPGFSNPQEVENICWTDACINSSGIEDACEDLCDD